MLKTLTLDAQFFISSGFSQRLRDANKEMEGRSSLLDHLFMPFFSNVLLHRVTSGMSLISRPGGSQCSGSQLPPSASSLCTSTQLLLLAPTATGTIYHSLISFNSNAFSRLYDCGLKPKVRNPHSHGVQKSGAHSYAAGLPCEVHRFIKVMFSGGFSEVFFHQNSLEMLHQRGDSGAIDFQDKEGAQNRHSFVEKRIDTQEMANNFTQ